jgi:hypothetical protein
MILEPDQSIPLARPNMIAQQARVSITIEQKATETLLLRQYKITQVQVTEEGNYVKRTSFL